MSELVPVLGALVEEVAAGRPCALCAVLETRGSTPQTPGAALLVKHDRSTVGTLGGGCVEAEVVVRAHKDVMPEGGRHYMTFKLNSNWGWDDGLVCGGRMDIGVMTFRPGDDVAAWQKALDNALAQRAAAFPVFAEREGEVLEYRIRLEQPPTLLIAGAGHVGQALARLAVELDFRVVCIDDRAEYASPERFESSVQLVVQDIGQALSQWPVDENTYVVIVTRGHRNDASALAAVVERPARYIGLIGSKRKKLLIYKDLAADGVSQEKLDAVHSPVGLPIGAVTVPEIAVSIAAQLVEERRKTPYAPVEGPLASVPSERMPPRSE